MTNEELDRIYRERSAEKLKLENDKIRKDLRVSPAVPLYISSTSALVAGLGLMLSTCAQRAQLSFQSEQAAAREKVDTDASVRAAAEMATETKAGADRRISGVYQLARHWSEPDEQPVVAATLSAVLGAGNAPGYSRLRCAAAEAIGMAISAPLKGWSQDGKEEQNRRASVASLLYGASDGRIGLVSNLNARLLGAWRAQPERARPAPAAEAQGDTSGHTPAAAETVAMTKGAGRADDVEAVYPPPSSIGEVLQCTSTLAATIEAIRKNWEHLRGVNLQDNTLRYGAFYQADMAGSALMRVDLTGTDLRQANLSGANLAGATGYESAKLEGANVANLVGASRPFCEYAIRHGAIQMPDDEWARWRASAFDFGTLRTILQSAPKPTCGG